MTLSTQFITLLTMLLSGVYVGAAYFTFNRLAPIWRNSITWKYLLEILFWFIQAMVLFTVLFVVNEGIVRFYLFLAVLCGFAMFKALFERLFSRVLEICIHVIKHLYRFFYQLIRILLVRPIVWIVTVIVVILLKIVSLLLTILKWVFFPITWLFHKVRKLLPKNAQNYLHLFHRFYSKIRRKHK
ncbi:MULTISPECIES: spore cortex biosynthesis protein YabQ [Gracilibacillus]|uniref:spore cortex biosynthesis protein YabQ n=1 Tax=Gracilibacillus TaxID=74385 RepID=UPI000825EF6C